MSIESASAPKSSPYIIFDDESDSSSPNTSENTSANEQSVDSEGGGDSPTASAANAIDPNENYTAADLVAMGLDPKVAEFLVKLHTNNYGDDELTMSGAKLLELRNRGDIDIKSSASGDTVSLRVNPSDGYTALEIMASSQLTPDQAWALVNSQGSDTIGQAVYDKAIDSNGQLTSYGRSIASEDEFSGNPLTADALDQAIDSNARFTAEQLELAGLSAEAAAYLTQDGPITGQQLKELVASGDLNAGKVGEDVQFRVAGSIESPPEQGVSALLLVNAGLSVEETEFLVSTHGTTEGKITQDTLDKYVVIDNQGNATLSPEGLKEFQSKNADEATLIADGAQYGDLIALGLTASQTDYLLSHYESPPDSGVIPPEKLEELKQQGFLVPDPAHTNPPRYMLGGEASMPAEEAAATAQQLAAGQDPNKPVLEIAPDGTGNFFVAGENANGNPFGVDTQQSVIFARAVNPDGSLGSEFAANNGNAQGLYDGATLVALGFSEAQVGAIFQHAGNPPSLTMTELRNAVAANSGGASEVAQVIGNAIVMRREGEAITAPATEPSPFAPTQQDAQWLNSTYGGGDGLTEAELAVALEEGVVQVVDGKVLMTAHGKARAFEEQGPSNKDVNAYQQDLLARAMLKVDPNDVGGNRSINFDQLISAHNGQMSDADASLLLETYGDGTTVSQKQLSEAIANGELIISEAYDGKTTSFGFKITPKGYENMAEAILSDPNNPKTQVVDGIMNYPDLTGQQFIDQEGLTSRHGLSNEDALSLVAAYDVDGDGKLSRPEMLKAYLSNSIVVDENNKITEVNIDNDSTAHVGPYTVETLAAKISSDQPPAADLAKAIFLEFGLDPGNPEHKLTDAQIEAWLRKNPILTEDANGTLSVVQPANAANIDDVWAAMGGTEGTLAIPLDRGSNYDKSVWSKNSTLTQGETYGLSSYLFNQQSGKEGQDRDNYNMTKDEMRKLVEDGILTLDQDGKVALTEKGKALIKANQAKDAMDFMDRAEQNGHTTLDPATGVRYMSGEYWTSDSAYQQGDGEDWSNDQSRHAQYETADGRILDFKTPDQNGQNVTGFYWSLTQGHERVDRKDGDTIQHETVG